MRPTILVDMDGPLAAFDVHFWERCQANGWPMDAELHGQTDRYGTGHVIDRQHRKMSRAMIDSGGWFADLPVVPGAVEGINRLAETSDVWICTKPLEDNPTCRDDKGAWVRRHLGGDWERRLIITPDKSMVVGDILLDDAPKVGWFPNAEWQPVIFTTSWNGPSTEWADYPHWTWESPEPLESLVELGNPYTAALAEIERLNLELALTRSVAG